MALFRWQNGLSEIIATKNPCVLAQFNENSCSYILHKIQQLMATFLWRGENKATSFHLSKWQNIASPKENGGWGIRNIFWFANSLVAKSCWRGLFGNSLWSQILERKYLKGVDLTSWLRKEECKYPNASNF